MVTAPAGGRRRAAYRAAGMYRAGNMLKYGVVKLYGTQGQCVRALRAGIKRYKISLKHSGRIVLASISAQAKQPAYCKGGGHV